jgi:hypothetical protein
MTAMRKHLLRLKSMLRSHGRKFKIDMCLHDFGVLLEPTPGEPDSYDTCIRIEPGDKPGIFSVAFAGFDCQLAPNEFHKVVDYLLAPEKHKVTPYDFGIGFDQYCYRSLPQNNFATSD